MICDSGDVKTIYERVFTNCCFKVNGKSAGFDDESCSAHSGQYWTMRRNDFDCQLRRHAQEKNDSKVRLGWM